MNASAAARTAVATAAILLTCRAGAARAGTNTVTFTQAPSGVTSLRVVAVGGRGGRSSSLALGGFGARVTGDLAVTLDGSGAYAVDAEPLSDGVYTAQAGAVGRRRECRQIGAADLRGRHDRARGHAAHASSARSRAAARRAPTASPSAGGSAAERCREGATR